MESRKHHYPDIKKMQEALVLAAIACLTFSYFGGYYLIITTIGHHSTLLRKMAVVLLFLKVLTTRYTKREFGFVAVLLSLAFANYKVSGNTRALYNFLTICALKDVELKKVFRVSLGSLVTIVLLMGILAVTGVTGTLSITDYFGRIDPETGYGKLETRYCMGYIHPNSWAQAIFGILVLSIAGFYEKLDWKGVIFFGIVNYTVYLYSISRTCFLGGMILLCLFLLMKYVRKLFDLLIVRIGFAAGTAALWGSVFALRIEAVTPIIAKWDMKFFTGRLSMAKHFVDRWGISAFGRGIPDELDGGYVLDMGYTRMLLENGLVIYLLLFFSALFLLFYAFRRKRYEVVILMISIFIYGLYENEAIAQVPANLVIYYLGEWLFNRDKNHQDTCLKNESVLE